MNDAEDYDITRAPLMDLPHWCPACEAEVPIREDHVEAAEQRVETLPCPVCRCPVEPL